MTEYLAVLPRVASRTKKRTKPVSLDNELTRTVPGVIRVVQIFTKELGNEWAGEVAEFSVIPKYSSW